YKSFCEAGRVAAASQAGLSRPDVAGYDLAKVLGIFAAGFDVGGLRENVGIDGDLVLFAVDGAVAAAAQAIEEVAPEALARDFGDALVGVVVQDLSRAVGFVDARLELTDRVTRVDGGGPDFVLRAADERRACAGAGAHHDDLEIAAEIVERHGVGSVADQDVA